MIEPQKPRYNIRVQIGDSNTYIANYPIYENPQTGKEIEEAVVFIRAYLIRSLADLERTRT